ncbi:acetyltransferase [Mesobacillus campisalis]|uniref:Acetyltransferase n=1 Tax=Mesobacillus campisalis TaxID=1408103 RepID=A0A0M2SYE2_9BACI|nr:acetyltransferase [Mesobacillus campisalis]KKK38726.1 acetyltransferase [Mesobacillus campisalis]
MKQLCVIGQGGHSKVIIDIIIAMKKYQIAACLDDKYPGTSKRKGILYGPVSLAEELSKEESMGFVIAIGCNKTRKKLFSELGLPIERFPVLVHPAAVVSPSSIIGGGTVVMPNSTINACAAIGNHAIINTGSVVEHDSLLGNYVHVCPNATLTGNVEAGEGAQIGAGAAIIPGIRIGRWSIVGAGSTVIHPVPDHEKVAGAPAKSILKVRV